MAKLDEHEQQEKALQQILRRVKAVAVRSRDSSARRRANAATSSMPWLKRCVCWRLSDEAIVAEPGRRARTDHAGTHQKVIQRGQEYKAEHERLKPQLEEATRKAITATEEATAAKALLQAAR